MAGQPDGLARPVDWLSGACLLTRTAAFRQVGGFAPDYFMYFEEVDLARRLAAYGWETWYEPAAQVVHHHSRSADRDPQAKDRHFFRSKYRFVATYWGGAAAGGLRLAAGLLFTAETAVQLVRRDRRLSRRDAALVRLHFT
jgi:GT2 family glycosyltransferase